MEEFIGSTPGDELTLALSPSEASIRPQVERKTLSFILTKKKISFEKIICYTSFQSTLRIDRIIQLM